MELLRTFFFNVESGLKFTQIVFIMGMAVAVAAVIFLTYRIAYQGVHFDLRFAVGNAVILMIASVIMMLIGTNAVLSLGAVGALAIIRFRTAIKDPQDTVYVFWSIAEGLCVGAQVYKIALLSTPIIALVLVIASMATKHSGKYLLIVRGDAELTADAVLGVLSFDKKKLCVKSASYEATHSEIIIEVVSRNDPDLKTVEALRGVAHVTGVNWLNEVGDYVG